MKYVSLLSGGKDSCFNLLHCQHHGHQLVAAASLGPPPGTEELDSYMYQTVGQDAIELVARALDVPLYRRIISGQAVEQGLDYGGRMTKSGIDGDETEDLYFLLSEVKANHPDIQGVSVGAILSNYQRVRVEHVCQRLSLTPLAYLWQRDQKELLAEMIEAGLTAVLIKVAGIGLTSKHLGKSLRDMRPTLEKLNLQYGSHICGEGGEYETLTVDCPMFKQRIVLENTEIVKLSDSDFAQVAYLRINRASLQPKTLSSIDLRIPPLLDDSSIASNDTNGETQHLPSLSNNAWNYHHPDSPPITSRKYSTWISIGNIQRRILSHEKEVTYEEEVRECFSLLQEKLHEHSLDMFHLTNVNIFLSSMDLFAQTNAIYAEYFGTSPPARACVAVDLPVPIRIRLDCIANAAVLASQRQALHVQGLSYWAPANIGPYSQAIIVDQRVHISGQIGLIPSSLSLPSPPCIKTETALAFQHAHRIMRALKPSSGDGWDGYEQGVLYWLSDLQNCSYVRQAEVAYRQTPIYPALFIAVKILPKGSLVEKQVLAHTGLCSVQDEEVASTTLQKCLPRYASGSISLHPDCEAAFWEISWFEESQDFCAVICINDSASLLQLKTVNELRLIDKHTLSVRLFYTPLVRPSENADSYCEQFFDRRHWPAVTAIPCRGIFSRIGTQWKIALFIVGSSM